MKLHYMLIVLIVLLSALCCDNNSDILDGLTYNKYVEIAQEYEKNAEYEKALSAMKKAIKLNPTDSNAHYILGRLYGMEEERTYREADNKRLFENMTNKPGAQNKNTDAYLEKLGYKKNYKIYAIKEYQQAVLYDPNNWSARYFIATDHYNNKRYKQAIDEFKNVIMLNSTYANPYGFLADIYLETGECKLALKYYTIYNEKEPNTEEYYCNTGKVYIKMKNGNKANEMLNKLKNNKHYYDELTDYEFEPHGKCLD